MQLDSWALVSLSFVLGVAQRLMAFVNDLHLGINRENYALLILLDLSAAFDRVAHEVLR